MCTSVKGTAVLVSGCVRETTDKGSIITAKRKGKVEATLISIEKAFLLFSQKTALIATFGQEATIQL